MKCSEAVYVTNKKCKLYVRQAQIKAYSYVLNAFIASGHLEEEHLNILGKLRECLMIPLDRHAAEIRRAYADRFLSTVSLKMSGKPFQNRLVNERGRNSMVIHRPLPVTKSTLIADMIASETPDIHNSKKVSLSTIKDLLDEEESIIKEALDPTNPVRKGLLNMLQACDKPEVETRSQQTSTTDLEKSLLEVTAGSRNFALKDPLTDNLAADEKYVYLISGNTLKVKETRVENISSKKRYSKDYEIGTKGFRKKRKTNLSKTDSTKETVHTLKEVIKPEKAASSRKKILARKGFAPIKQAKDYQVEKAANVWSSKSDHITTTPKVTLSTPDNPYTHNHVTTTEKVHDTVMTKIQSSYHLSSIEKAQNMFPQSPVPPERIYAAGGNSLYHNSSNSNTPSWAPKLTRLNSGNDVSSVYTSGMKRKQEHKVLSEWSPPVKLLSKTNNNSSHQNTQLKKSENQTMPDGRRVKTINSQWKETNCPVIVDRIEVQPPKITSSEVETGGLAPINVIVSGAVSSSHSNLLNANSIDYCINGGNPNLTPASISPQEAPSTQMSPAYYVSPQSLRPTSINDKEPTMVVATKQPTPTITRATPPGVKVNSKDSNQSATSEAASSLMQLSRVNPIKVSRQPEVMTSLPPPIKASSTSLPVVITSSSKPDVVTSEMTSSATSLLPCQIVTSPSTILKVSKSSAKGSGNISQFTTVKSLNSGQNSIILVRTPGSKSSVVKPAKILDLGSGGKNSKIHQIKTITRSIEVGTYKSSSSTKALSGTKLVNVGANLRVSKNISVAKVLGKGRVSQMMMQKTPSSISATSSGGNTRKLISVCQSNTSADRETSRGSNTSTTSGYKPFPMTFPKPGETMQPLTPIAVLNSMRQTQDNQQLGTYPTIAKRLSAANVAQQQHQPKSRSSPEVLENKE